MTNKKSAASPTSQFDWQLILAKIEDFFTNQLPPLPETAKESIVKYSPYIAGILALVALPMIFGSIRVMNYFSSWGAAFGVAPTYSVQWTMLLSISSIVLELIALPGLMKRTKKSWTLMTYSLLLSAAYSLLTAGIINFLLSLAISLYFLFQIKSYYKN